MCKTESNSKEIAPLVKELYQNVPEFDLLSDHMDDELLYTVFGDLSLILGDQIMAFEEPNKLITDSFQFFNLIGDRNDPEIDNLLVVGIYEELYSKKKCNDIARSLLKGRNKEVYEHWMLNGNIRSNY
jgi:hypothetical protein